MCIMILSIGSFLDGNTKLDAKKRDKIQCESFEDILKRKGKFDEFKRILETKPSRK